MNRRGGPAESVRDGPSCIQMERFSGAEAIAAQRLDRDEVRRQASLFERTRFERELRLWVDAGAARSQGATLMNHGWDADGRRLGAVRQADGRLGSPRGQVASTGGRFVCQ